MKRFSKFTPRVPQSLLQLLLLVATAPLIAQEAPRALFDGETMKGWETVSADQKWWRVDGDRIVGGSLEEQVPHNTFLSTVESFHNFELEFDILIEGNGGFINSGFQVRSKRVEGSSEMSGYQVDAGPEWWGKMYDESRRNRVIAEPGDSVALAAAIKPNNWNHYRIRADGRQLQAWINGVPTINYTEADGNIPLDGHLGLQVHGGGKVQVSLRNIQVTELKATPGAMTWRRFEKAQSVATQGKSPIKTPEQEMIGFDVLDGFEVELVAADPIMQKVVDIAFDDAGRMWAITAVEYPIDGNESGDVVGLYRKGGRDQVLVFDEPWKQGLQTPRVFADGLFIPMAILPDNGSVLVGRGPDILRFYDDDKDGRADRQEVMLSGFGVQDSHLLPHRFVRAPGGWIYMAQGAFNSSQVVTTSGDITTFNKCKVARFQQDGSQFEIVGIGLNNIWGFVIDRLGDKWVQEANDLGFPVAPFEHGMSYPGIGSEKFHPYSPWRPTSTMFRMGGTGLSGLAQSGDRSGFPAPWNETFFLANPIISSLQSVRVNRDAATPHEVEMERVADLMTSVDKNFRPVAIHFGPDGCLYVVDWYNPIISHNEVPRDHPDRDKISSRIWRIRHKSQKVTAPIDVTKVATEELVGLLGADSTVTARAAWHQISDRQAVELIPQLQQLAQSQTAPVADRVLALWSLQDVNGVTVALLEQLIADNEFAIRREAARLAGETGLHVKERMSLFAGRVEEKDPRVRLALIQSITNGTTNRHGANNNQSANSSKGSEAEIGFLMQLLEGTTGDYPSPREASDDAFERSLVRAYIEMVPDAALAFTKSPAAKDLYGANIRFMWLSAGTAEAASAFAKAVPSSNLEPMAEELAFLAQHMQDADVLAAMTAWLGKAETQVNTIQLLLEKRNAWQSDELTEAIALSARSLLAKESNQANTDLLLRVARELRCKTLEPDVITLLEQRSADPLECLKALAELDCRNSVTFYQVANASLPGEQVRRIAVIALAAIPGEEAFSQLLDLWPSLENNTRQPAINALLSRKDGAQSLLAALNSDQVGLDGIGLSSLQQMREHLGDSPALVELEQRLAVGQIPGLFLDGQGNSFVDSNLTIDGPFTIEAWIRLNNGINNADGLLASAGRFDLNFHDARLRLWTVSAGDLTIATKPVIPGAWTHFAVVREANNQLHIYINGELDCSTSSALPLEFDDLDIGRTNPGVGTAAAITEFRLWDTARSAEQIGANYRLMLDPENKPKELQALLPGNPFDLSGTARIEGILDRPPVVTAEEAQAEIASFARYRSLIDSQGNVQDGLAIFNMSCAVCHQVNNVGGTIGPTLDSVASKGTEGLLRSILTPNAGVESGYRILNVKLHDGQLLQGYLAAEDSENITLRRQGRDDLQIARKDIASLRFADLSLMPEGLLDALTDQQAADLFEYLMSLN
jgi:putative membrane-bound dehydrogenase-like protein